MDELAHTNVPGVENEKRYQDVEDLLEAGISVMTTVNIQHFESVQEIVSRVTDVEVRERVPDRLLRQADAVVNVDLPSEELRERLKAGKIYPADRVPAGARELLHRGEPRLSARARRCARSPTGSRRSGADRPVGGRRARRRQGHGGDVVQPRRSTRLLLRRASAIAGRLNTNWFAVYVRTKRDSPQRMSAREHRLLSENVTLAMELGAKVVWLTGEDVAGELLRFAREHGITLAIFGKSSRPCWRRLVTQEPDRRLRGRGDRHRRLRDRDRASLTRSDLPE